MKTKLLRCGILCTIVIALCAGLVFQYMNDDHSERTNAVLVMLYQE